LAVPTATRRRMRCLLRKSVIFFENIYYNSSAVVCLCPRLRWWSSAVSGSWPTAGRSGSAAAPVACRLRPCGEIERVKKSGVGSIRAAEFSLAPPAGRGSGWGAQHKTPQLPDPSLPLTQNPRADAQILTSPASGLGG